MIINHLKNSKLLAVAVLLGLLKIGLLPSVTQALPQRKNLKPKAVRKVKIAPPKDNVNRTLDINLLASRHATVQTKKIKIENKNNQHNSQLSAIKQTIPIPNQILIANSFSGEASWYGPGFHGRTTASGEVYDQNAMTAAHPSLEFGTKVQVTNLNNNRSVIVTINDRGPYAGGRIIDLSAAAASSLDMVSSGVAPVSVTILTQ
jgi:rare lipoprotein A